MRRYFLFPAAVFVLIFILVGCSISQLKQLNPSPTEIYRPPTLAVQSLPLLTPTPTSLPPSPTPSCTNYLRYLQDITIPDGTLVLAGDVLDKRWRVENSGTCNWDQTYTLRLITGTDMKAEKVQALFPARSGAQFDLQIIFTAPDEPGIYRSAWQAFDSQDQPFGDSVFIEIIVQ